MEEKKEIKKGNGNLLSMDGQIFSPELFCKECKMIPKYSIIVNKNGLIVLSHICNGHLRNGFPINGQNIRFEKKCKYCSETSITFCMKCNEIVCEKCFKEHIPEEKKEEKGIKGLDMFQKESNKICCTYFEQQFFCQKHLFKFKYFCPICNVNLCDNCIISHCHTNYIPFSKEQRIIKITNKKVIIDEKGKDISKKLTDVSNSFKDCYFNGKNKDLLTLNILSNYHLIKTIDSYISDLSGKIKINQISSIMKSDFYQNEKEVDYLAKNFGDYEFMEKYKLLILYVHSGDLRYKRESNK